MDNENRLDRVEAILVSLLDEVTAVKEWQNKYDAQQKKRREQAGMLNPAEKSVDSGTLTVTGNGLITMTTGGDTQAVDWKFLGDPDES